MVSGKPGRLGSFVTPLSDDSSVLTFRIQNDIQRLF